jgi:hypothetical protein
MEAILAVVLSVLQVLLLIAACVLVAHVVFGGVLSSLWSMVTGGLTWVKRSIKALFHVKGNRLTIHIPSVDVKVGQKD